MNILQRAGLGHLAERLTAVGADLPPPEPDTFDLVAMRREQARGYLRGHWCRTQHGDAEVGHPVAADWVRRVLADDPEVKPTLLVSGNTGSGKSYLAWAVLRAIKLGRAEQGRGCLCWMVDHADLNEETRPRPDEAHLTVFERYDSADLLVLDDLAATRATDWTEETLYRLVQRRWRARRATVVVTNLPTVRPAPGRPSPLEVAVGARVESRLLDAAVVVLVGPDRRKADAPTRTGGPR